MELQFSGRGDDSRDSYKAKNAMYSYIIVGLAPSQRAEGFLRLPAPFSFPGATVALKSYYANNVRNVG